MHGFFERIEECHLCGCGVRGFVKVKPRICPIADYLYLSRPYLSATFKQQAGISLAEYIAKEKIEEAHRLLLYTKKTVLEISEGLGFSSQSHFTNIFKKYMGCTPKSIRKEPN